MIDIRKVDDKNITLNGKSCAAVYKADAGEDEKGEFVLISEIGGGYKTKIRIEELLISGEEQRSAGSAVHELNRFIGNFKKGGGGSGSGVQTVNGAEPDEDGNVSLNVYTKLQTDTKISEVNAKAEMATYRTLKAGSNVTDKGFLVCLMADTAASSYGVIELIGNSAADSLPIKTVLQFYVKGGTGIPPQIELVSAISYGYELKELSLFYDNSSLAGSKVYLWIPLDNPYTCMAISYVDSSSSIGDPSYNRVLDAQLTTLPALRLGEVVFTPSSPFPLAGSWIPSLTGVSSIAHANAYFTKVGNLVRCQTLITTQVAGGVGAVQLNGLPYPIKAGLGSNNQYPIELSVSAALGNVSDLIGFCGTFSADEPNRMAILKIINTAGQLSYAEVYGSEVPSYTSFRFRFDYLTN